MSTVVVVANQKGGAGKTATAVNLAAVYAEQGKRVLLVDADPQANATEHLGVDPALALSLYDVLVDRGALSVGEVLVQSAFGIDVVPGSLRVAELNIALAVVAAGQTRLATVLEEQARDYDVVVIDTQPELALLTISALVAADVVVVPVSAQDSKSARGYALLQQTNEKTAPLRRQAPAPLIPLLTRLDRRRILASRMQVTMEMIGPPAAAQIREYSGIQNSTDRQMPLVVLEPDHVVASEYRQAAGAALAATAAQEAHR